MVFDATVFYIENLMIMHILSSDDDDIQNNSKVYYSDDDFLIKRVAHAEIITSGRSIKLFLPGAEDWEKGPWTVVYRFENKTSLDSFLIKYDKAYKQLNGCSPSVIDLKSMPEYEDTPEMRLA